LVRELDDHRYSYGPGDHHASRELSVLVHRHELDVTNVQDDHHYNGTDAHRCNALDDHHANHELDDHHVSHVSGDHRVTTTDVTNVQDDHRYNAKGAHRCNELDDHHVSHVSGDHHVTTTDVTNVQDDHRMNHVRGDHSKLHDHVTVHSLMQEHPNAWNVACDHRFRPLRGRLKFGRELLLQTSQLLWLWLCAYQMRLS
jgi:hypothetical protein